MDGEGNPQHFKADGNRDLSTMALSDHLYPALEETVLNGKQLESSNANISYNACLAFRPHW